MKNMKRIISLLMALMLMGSSVTANADMIVSNSEGIRLHTVASETNTDLNHFLTDASITDPRTHQEVTGQVETGRDYKIRVEFSEGNRDNQFQVNGNHQMTYRFPDGLTVSNLDGQYPVTVGGVKIGVYTIQDNTLTFTPWYSTDQVNYEPYNAEEMQGNPNYKTYADFAVNTEIWFDVVGQFAETEGKFKFTDSLNKEWNVVPERNEPVIELKKESQYDEEANKFHYTIHATVTNADAGDLTITDALADMMGMEGIDSSTLKITKQTGGAAAEGSGYTLNRENGETIIWTDKETPDGTHKAGFTMTLKDVKKDDTFTIEYDAPIDTAALERARGENDVGLTIGHNRVTAAAKDTNSQVDWWGQFFPGKKPIQKQYVGQPEGDKSILKWKLTVGSKNETNPENKVNGKTVTDTWSFDTNIESVSLDKAAGVKITLYPFGDGQKQEITLKEDEVSNYLTEKTDGTGFTFIVPDSAFDVKYCEVEYQTDCRMKGESEGGTSTGTGDVTNTAEFGGQSASATGTAGGEKPLPELNPTKTLVDSNADELVFRYTVDIPREYIGREKVWFEDEFRLRYEYKEYWIYNKPSRITVMAVGKESRKEQPITAGTGAYTYQYCKETGGENIKKFYLFFNANEKIGNADNSGSKSGLWAWDEDEDVTLTIEYAISKNNLVADKEGWGSYQYPDCYSNKISEVTKGVLVNTGKINNKDATAELNITRKVVKHAEVTDSDTGEVTYTVDLNKTGLNQIPENAIFTDTYDDHMEFVDGSLRVCICWNNTEQANIVAEPQYKGQYLNEGKHQITLQFEAFGGGLWEAGDKHNWNYLREIYKPDGGETEAVNAYKAAQDWYRREYKDQWNNNQTKYPWIRIEYRLRLKDQYVDGNPYRVNNTAKLGDWVGASASATVKPKMLKKSMTSDGGLLKYAITVNPSGSQLGDGGKLTLTDVMTNLSPMMDSSLKVIDKGTKETLQRGTDWNVAYDAENHQMTFTLPNSRALEIQYSARATGTGKVNISNKATLLGESSTVGKQDFNASDTSSGANQSAYGFQISKVKTGTKIGLEGAEFQITYFHKTDKGIEEFPFGSYTTNEYGVALIDQGNDSTLGNNNHVYANTVYCIVETKAPERYEASGQERYIYIDASGEHQNSIDEVTKWLNEQGKTVTKCVNWETITIENSPASQRFPFSFTKTDPLGKALPGATFTLTDTSANDPEDPRTATSGENGAVTFTDLKPGKTYWLAETRAPGGYLLSTETWTIEVGADGGMTVTDRSGKTVEKPDGGYRFANREIPTLPSVGGRGTAAYGLLGLALMAMATAAAYTLARRKKASGAE